MLNQFITNIISISGLLSPQQLDQFKLQIAKAAGKAQEEDKKDIKQSGESLTNASKEILKEKSRETNTEGKTIEGFEMVEEKAQETEITSSGSSWIVIVIVLGILTLLFVGWRKKS
jgi:cobaltochelatase CobN